MMVSISLHMTRISISLSDEEDKWLKNHSWVSPSGLFKDALGRLQNMTISPIKNSMRDEIIRRINLLKPELRIKVLIHDTKEFFKFGPKYPDDDISYLMKWIHEMYNKCKKMEAEEQTIYCHLPEWSGTAYATVIFKKEFDKENHPIVEFESQFS